MTRTSSTSSPRSSEEPLGETRVHRRDARAAELVERLDGRLGRDGGLERAGAEAETEELRHRGAALLDEVGAGDPAVDDAVLDVLGHVGRAHEQDVDRCVAAREGERPLAGLLRAEARVGEQRDGRLAEPALRGDCDRQAVRPEVRFRRSSTSR